MKKFLSLALVIALAACTHPPKKLEIHEVQSGEYELEEISESHWSGDFLAADLLTEAENYCSSRNLSFERIAADREDERGFNYARAKILFKCVK